MEQQSGELVWVLSYPDSPKIQEAGARQNGRIAQPRKQALGKRVRTKARGHRILRNGENLKIGGRDPSTEMV